MKRIKLSQRKYAIVDDEDYARVRQFKWHCLKAGKKNGKKTYYAARNIRILLWVQRREYLHHFILKAEPGFLIDHVNGDGLDCTRSNLRQATSEQNRQNRGKQLNNTSGFKGVSWDKSKNKWQVHIGVKRKSLWVGRYDTAEEAAHAYDEAARKYHGAFARTNF